MKHDNLYIYLNISACFLLQILIISLYFNKLNKIPFLLLFYVHFADKTKSLFVIKYFHHDCDLEVVELSEHARLG